MLSTCFLDLHLNAPRLSPATTAVVPMHAVPDSPGIRQ
uniref:Uncharacterized protein n=1 Tax=Toxoplasma gondii TgCATBr9 TaxID=943120 RepID=A0A2T6IM77_TOXGO|nr:hypothetical protein TGBR9_214610A [Toxoplasma gondii TgCATBr9]